MQRKVLAIAVILTACGGKQGSAPTTPVASPTQALSEFIRAASDSNLTRMSQLWGSSRGPAAETRDPPDFEKRLVVMQVYLRADSSKVVSNMPVMGDDDRRRLMVQIFRQGCMKQIPATLRRVKGAWFVYELDLPSSGNPARPCEEP